MCLAARAWLRAWLCLQATRVPAQQRAVCASLRFLQPQRASSTRITSLLLAGTACSACCGGVLQMSGTSWRSTVGRCKVRSAKHVPDGCRPQPVLSPQPSIAPLPLTLHVLGTLLCWSKSEICGLIWFLGRLAMVPFGRRDKCDDTPDERKVVCSDLTFKEVVLCQGACLSCCCASAFKTASQPHVACS
jgi:hypothetical protein